MCDIVYECLKSEHRDTALLNATAEDQPAITRRQQRLFVLLVRLQEQHYPSLLARMENLLWHNMFGRDRMYNLKLNAVQNCTRMFVLCARYANTKHLREAFLNKISKNVTCKVLLQITTR